MPALLIVGLLLIVSGLSLLVYWFEFFLILIKALLPFVLIVVGTLLAYFGWEEKRDQHSAFMDFSSPDEADRYQAEALAYQEKIDGLQVAVSDGPHEEKVSGIGDNKAGNQPNN